MTDGETTSTPGVHVTRLVEATPETVFSILATEEGFSSCMDGKAEFEAVAGSPFQIRFPRFATVVSGQVLEVVPGQLLVVSWGVSEGPQAATFPSGSSKVSIALRATDQGTEVTLSHTELPSTEEATQHEAGRSWTGGTSCRCTLGIRSSTSGTERLNPMARFNCAVARPSSSGEASTQKARSCSKAPCTHGSVWTDVFCP